jgi:hypothetical protein
MASVTLLMACTAYHKRRRFIERCNLVPGPPAPLPLVGNALEIMREPDGQYFFLFMASKAVRATNGLPFK